MSFAYFALIAIVAGWVCSWTVVLVGRCERYAKNRRCFRFNNLFEHIGQERAEQALAERFKQEAREAADRIRIAEDIR